MPASFPEKMVLCKFLFTLTRKKQNARAENEKSEFFISGKRSAGAVSGANHRTYRTYGLLLLLLLLPLGLSAQIKIGGSVYGGGDESAVGEGGSTVVTIKGGSQVTGDVFGGGNNGNVGGTTTVNIEK